MAANIERRIRLNLRRRVLVLFEDRVERHDGRDRLSRVHGIDLADDRARHAGWIPVRADDKQVRQAGCRERHVDLRHDRVGQSGV